MGEMQKDLELFQDTINNINAEGITDPNAFADPLGLENGEEQATEEQTENPDLLSGDEQVPHHKKKTRTGENRIKDLTHEKRLLQAEIHKLAQDNLEREQIIHQQNQLLQQRDQQSFHLQEESLKSQITSAQKEWQKAFDEGDSEKLAEAATRLSYHTSQLVNTKNNKEQYEYYTPYSQQRSAEPIPPQNQSQYASQVQNWIDDNTWYDTNAEEFNPQLRKKVDQYANEVLNHYFAPDDPRYIHYLNDFVQNQTNSQSSNGNSASLSNSSRQPPMRKTQQMVAPVNHGQGNPNGRSDPVARVLQTLTAEEKSMAHAMIYNDPKLNTDNEAKERKYAEGKYKYLQQLQQKKQLESMQGGFML